MPRFNAAALREKSKQNLAQSAATAVAAKEETEQLLSGARTGNATLPIEQIHPDPDQPRKSFDREGMDELKRAILALGGLENPVQIYYRDGLGFTIKHGERRFRALKELLDEGHDRFRQVPVLMSPPPDRSPEGEQRLRIAQVVENNARRGLLPLETAEQFHLIATSGREEPIPATHLAELTGTEERVVQRFLFVVGGLTGEERAGLREAWPEAPLRPLYALVQWLQEHGRRLDAEQRAAAIERFARERPTERMVRVALRDLAPKKKPGRPARKRFTSGTTRTGAFQVKLTLPPELVRDAASIRKARADLQRVQEQLQEMERALGEAEGE
ncbi:MAG TPA: ParB N-terminal domain-containing protein [Longimicrobiaceae bacterium]|nr:ParB N-terminal domain-containing protein [Longimicrobiaceae bacterium]